MKILYTDYNTALVYTCNKLIDSRHCAAGEESLAVYTRFWQHYTDVLDHLDHFTENTCYRKMDMEPVSHIGQQRNYVQIIIMSYNDITV